MDIFQFVYAFVIIPCNFNNKNILVTRKWKIQILSERTLPPPAIKTITDPRLTDANDKRGEGETRLFR